MLISTQVAATLGIATVISLGSSITMASDIPQTPASIQSNIEDTYYLGITINGLDRHRIEPIELRQGHFWMQADALKRLDIRLPADATGLIQLDAIPDVRTTYDGPNQMLRLTVPSEWLPAQHIGHTNSTPNTTAHSSFGVLLNYNAYYSDPAKNGQSYLSMLTEQRAFSRFGILSNTGVFTRYFGLGGESKDQRHRYRRYDTYWQYNDQDRIQSYQLGDFISGSLNWSSAVRMGGFRWSRNFGVRPDLVTYPMLNFKGDAAVPSTVDLFINGAKASSENLQPGPFTLSNVPYINGAGQATVVTTDALGRQVSTSLPFYVSNTLLAPGFSDFDVSLGKLRRNYGRQDFSYGAAAASGIYRYGVTPSLTVSAHAQGASRLTLTGLGADLGVGVYGTLSVAATQSKHHNQNGQQYVAGYSYYGNNIGFAVQRMQRVGSYQDLTSVDNKFRLARRSDQATASLQIQQFGSIGAGYFNIHADDGSQTRLLNLSYNRALWGNSSVYLSVNKELGTREYSAILQLIIPLNDQGLVSLGLTRDTKQNYTERASWSRSAPSQGGIGANVGYSSGKQQYHQASVTWRAQQMQLQGGFYGERNHYTRWADLSGSLILMDKAIFASNQVSDAFVLVSTQGYRDVPIRYENQLMGKTNSTGHLLIPWVSSYYPAKFGIETLNLPSNVITKQVEQRVAVAQGSGYLLNFPLEKQASANVTLVDPTGHAIPLGSHAVDLQSGARSMVGWDGQAYFERLQRDNRLDVFTPEGRQCSTTFTLDTQQAQIAQVGPLVCAWNSVP